MRTKANKLVSCWIRKNEAWKWEKVAGVYFDPSCKFICHECKQFPIWCSEVRARIFKKLAQFLLTLTFCLSWFWGKPFPETLLLCKLMSVMQTEEEELAENWETEFKYWQALSMTFLSLEVISKIRVCVCAELGQLNSTTSITDRNGVARWAVLSSTFCQNNFFFFASYPCYWHKLHLQAILFSAGKQTEEQGCSSEIAVELQCAHITQSKAAGCGWGVKAWPLQNEVCWELDFSVTLLCRCPDSARHRSVPPSLKLSGQLTFKRFGWVRANNRSYHLTLYLSVLQPRISDCLDLTHSAFLKPFIHWSKTTKYLKAMSVID